MIQLDHAINGVQREMEKEGEVFRNWVGSAIKN